MAFEFVDMSLEERGRYRRMLAGHLSHSATPSEPDPVAATHDAALSR
jgi:hypothetical protein